MTAKAPRRFSFTKSTEVIAPIAFDVIDIETGTMIGHLIRTRHGYDYSLPGSHVWHETFGVSRETAAGNLRTYYRNMQVPA